MITDEINEEFDSLLLNTKNNNINNILKYIKNKGGLTQEQTAFLFNLYYKDKENGVALENSISRTILIMSYDGFISYVLKKKNLFGEDCYSVGKLGLIKAIDSFSLDKNLSFMTYAYECIKNEVFLYLRKENKVGYNYGRVVSIDCQENCNNEEFSLLEILKSEDRYFEEVAEKSEIESIYKLFVYLPHKDQYVLSAYIGLFENPLNQIEIAKKLNLSQSFICRLIASAINRLQEVYNNLKEGKEQDNYYGLLTKEKYFNFEFEDHKEKRIIHKKAEQIVKEKQSSEDNKEKYIKILKHLKPIEQICVIYKFKLYGKGLSSTEQIAKKIDYSPDKLTIHFNNALRKAYLLTASSLNKEEEIEREMLLKTVYRSLNKNNYLLYSKQYKKIFVAQR